MLTIISVSNPLLNVVPGDRGFYSKTAISNKINNNHHYSLIELLESTAQNVNSNVWVCEQYKITNMVAQI